MFRGANFALGVAMYFIVMIVLGYMFSSSEAKADPDISSDGCVITIEDIPNNFCNGD